jgi:hypothetical protein
LHYIDIVAFFASLHSILHVFEMRAHLLSFAITMLTLVLLLPTTAADEVMLTTIGALNDLAIVDLANPDRSRYGGDFCCNVGAVYGLGLVGSTFYTVTQKGVPFVIGTFDPCTTFVPTYFTVGLNVSFIFVVDASNSIGYGVAASPPSLFVSFDLKTGLPTTINANLLEGAITDLSCLTMRPKTNVIVGTFANTQIFSFYTNGTVAQAPVTIASSILTRAIAYNSSSTLHMIESTTANTSRVFTLPDLTATPVMLATVPLTGVALGAFAARDSAPCYGSGAGVYGITYADATAGATRRW